MAENVGSVTYSIDVNTKTAIDNQKKIAQENSKVEKSFKSLDTTVTKTSKSVNQATNSMGGFGRSAGQAGIQIQQFVDQVRGGQSAMLALSQQSADLGIVLGAPLVGVVVALGAALVGTLIPSLEGSSEKAEELTEKLQELSKASTLTTAQSEFLVAVTNDEIDANRKLVSESDERIERLQRTVDVYDRLNAKVEEGQKLTTAERRSYKLLGENIDETRRKLLQETAARDTLNKEIETSETKIKAYTAAVEDSISDQKKAEEQTKRYASAFETLTDKLELQIALVGKSAREQAKLNAQSALGSEATIAQVETVNSLIDTLYDKVDAENAAAEAVKNRAKAELESKEASKAFIEGFGAELPETEGAFATGISREIIEENETLADELQRQRDMILMFQELEIGDAQTHADALVAIKKKQAEEERRIQSQLLSASSDFFGASADLIGTFAGESSGAYKALFAVSKGFAIANAALQLQTAIANAAALPWPANLPAITQAVSLGTSIASNIAAVSYSGGRERGIAAGPVSAGNMYTVGENNKPEVFVPNGIAMIPGSNGKVFNQDQLDQIGGSSNDNGNTVINNYITQNINGNGDKALAEVTKRATESAVSNLTNQIATNDGKFSAAMKGRYGEGVNSGGQM